MEIPLDTRLETARCYLRSVSYEDEECVWSASRTEGFTDGMRWDPPQEKSEIRQYTDKTIDNWKSGTSYTFSICLRDTDECIGRIDIRKESNSDVWSIGYWLHPDWQGNGYMTEAVLAILSFGFTELQVTAIESAHALWNEASGKVLTSTGFAYARNNPQGFMKHGKWVEEREYVLKKEDWEAAHSVE